MRRIVIATGCNKAYYPKVHRYMQSVFNNWCFDAAYLVGVGWQPYEIELNFRGVHLPLEQAVGHSGIYCVQGGSFLDVLPVEDEDIVIFTDGGDVVMQRKLSPKERSLLGSFDLTQVMVGHNVLGGDTLRAETPRLHPTREVPEKFDLDLPNYNTGVIVASAHAYRRLYELYKKHWHEVETLFDHYARQQWLISWILGFYKEHFNVVEMPRSFHAHNHYGMHDCKKKGVVVYHPRRRGKPVLFRHMHTLKVNPNT